MAGELFLGSVFFAAAYLAHRKAQRDIEAEREAEHQALIAKAAALHREVAHTIESVGQALISADISITPKDSRGLGKISPKSGLFGDQRLPLRQ